MKNIPNIRVSIYYAMNRWHNLLKTLPSAFGPCLIFLSIDRGDNIRLVVFGEDKKIKNKLSNYLTQFLIDQPSSNLETVFQPGSSLWMNYEHNSIQFNNFGIPRFLNHDDPALKYCKAISSYIIQNIANEEISLAITLNYGIFLTIHLVRLFEKEDIKVTLELAINSILKEYDLIENSNLLPAINRQVLEDYPDNKETIHDCYSDDNGDDMYLRDVIAAAGLIKNIADTGVENQAWCFYLLNNFLNNHLGITPANGIYILKLMEKYFNDAAQVNTC